VFMTSQVTKAVNINVVASPAGSLLPYRVQVTDKHVLSEDEKKTQECARTLSFHDGQLTHIPDTTSSRSAT
jgi:hypothetical protein